MSKRMIIDSSHREETRVVVLDGQKVEEFDFEAASKRPLKGNIYLAKVTRVEPSLQAAFVEYGGNRQGFLAFAEIHPDYYQIPIADRLALLAEREVEARRHADEEIESFEVTSVPARDEPDQPAESATDLPENDDHSSPKPAMENSVELNDGSLQPMLPRDEADTFSVADVVEDESLVMPDAAQPAPSVSEEQDAGERKLPATETLQAAKPLQRWTRKRHYKIQEVIKRRQVMLVQVVKEERGNKGAALTSYLSLAGRYCVLMPNTPRGGGISRKITSVADRTRLKSAAQALELPEGMGLIIRTAGENRTKAEIKRDYEYLLRMWDTIRELTLKSNAPACVYEEGDLIKRAIRDLYNKDVSEIIVEGDEGYRNAKDFMRMLMPSHAKNVKPYKESIPLFQRYQIESQLDAMFVPTVTLRSGGYIVINQTEALVSIDVNSGKATREHSIEETAYKTNLEAAEEVARQLRLRDLAGLIVIDFIDMEDARNDRNVEKRLRDCIKNDRARVQIGRISQFGLLEMSRQRLRAGVVAGSTVPCPHCAGQGIVRSVESTALRLLRALEEEAQRQRAASLAVRAPTEVAIYAFNQKRREIAHIESEYALTIRFDAKNEMMAGTFEIDRIGQHQPEDRIKSQPAAERIVPATASPAETIEPEFDTPEPEEPQQPSQLQSPSTTGKRKRRRRRGRDRDRPTISPVTPAVVEPGAIRPEPETFRAQSEIPINASPGTDATHTAEHETGRKRRRRRRGRRGTRQNGGASGQATNSIQSSGVPAAGGASPEPEERPSTEIPGLVTPLATPPNLPNAPSEPVWSLSAELPSADDLRRDTHEATPMCEPESRPSEAAAVEPAAVERSEAYVQTEPRKGWWQRTFRSREED
jgi:ribonuclease E